MRGAVKHIVLLVLALILVLFFLIPAIRRMEPHHDVVPPPVHDTTGGSQPTGQRKDEPRVRDEREKPRETAPPLRIGEWRELAAWNGIGMVTTEPFTVHSHTWRVVWETEVLPVLGAGLFQVMVYDAQGGLKSVAATTDKTDKGETMLPGPGTFTLSVNTLQKWKVKVEEKG